MAKRKETRPAVRKFTGSTTEKLEMYLRQKPGIVLTETEEHILERYHMAMSIMTKDKEGYPNTEAETAKKMKAHFGISLVTAYHDISEAQKLYGNAFTVKKSVKQKMAMDMAIEAIRWALRDKDLEQYIKALNTFNKIIAELPDTPEEKPQQITNVLVINSGEGTRKAVDMNKIHELNEDDFNSIADTIHKEGLNTIDIESVLMEEEEEDEAG
ncbi:hypothetical protein [Marivirga sp.]|uniref:hypothetical protein n=1 Tax=Marivirga sp. TaxID=2018662 RepID=UPI003DA73E08